MEAKQAKGLMEAYASIYTNITEDHFKVGDEVVCKSSGMEGEIVKLDKPHGEDDEKYYTVKREDGKTMKYAPNDLKLAKKEKESEKESEKEDVKEAKNGGISKSAETKFHKKLDSLVHHTFGKRKEEKAMKEEVDDEGGKHKEGKHPKGKEEPGEKVTEKEGKEKEEKEMKEGVSYSAKKARAGKDIGKPGKMFGKIAKEAGKRYGSKERGEKVAGAVLAGLREGTDLFDYLLEYLVAEGYADTNQAAIAIMANMSEEWRQSIVEQRGAHYGLVGVPQKPIDAIPGVRALRTAISNTANRLDYPNSTKPVTVGDKVVPYEYINPGSLRGALAAGMKPVRRVTDLESGKSKSGRQIDSEM